MFHSGPQTLIDHWSALPQARRIPARADFQPHGPRQAGTPTVHDRARRQPLRLAGGWIEQLHGRPLRGIDWLDLWREESRRMVAAAMVQTFREARPVVLAADAAGMAGLIEIVIAPLRNAQDLADRLVGLYQPVAPGDRDAEDVGLLSARLSIGVGELDRPPLSLAAIDGRRIA